MRCFATKYLVSALLVLLLNLSAHAAGLIQQVYTDKSRHDPGDSTLVVVDIKNTTGAHWSGNVEVYPRFLGESIGLDQSQWLSIGNDQTTTLFYTVNLPSNDFRGYLFEVWCWKSGGGVTDRDATAADVSSNWKRFPRYGYLTEFGDNADNWDLLQPMRRFHINGVQYYDWADKHHVIYQSGFNYWQDIAKRTPWVSKSKLDSLIQTCHDFNMEAMAYQLIHGTYDNYWNDGVQVSWGLFTQPANQGTWNQDKHSLAGLGWETNDIWLFNPAHTDWRNWMKDQFQNVFANFAFDGWHIDTLGDPGAIFNWDGESVNLAGTYPGFVNYQRAHLGSDKNYVINTVSNYGESEVAVAAEVDFVYSELWGEPDEDDFYDLKTTLEGIRDLTQKNMVVAGYMNYNYSKQFSASNPGNFNTPSILLADAAIFANGGWHIELGDGLNLLSNEYFPNKNLVMSADLERRLHDYYNFAVAYQNLLRDDIYPGGKPIDYDLGGSVQSGYDGSANRVWKLSKWRPGLDGSDYFDIAHLINLSACDHTVWRDPDADFDVPATINQKKVRVYYNDPWGSSRVYYASPDFDEGKAFEVTNYQVKWDTVHNMNYIEFVLPKHKYWTMIWLERYL